MRIQTPASPVIKPIFQRVYIDNIYYPDVMCESVNSAISTASTAEFSCPGVMWDEKNFLAGCRVSVEVIVSNRKECIFYGYIQRRSGDPGSQTCNFTAESPMGAMADMVYIGDGRKNKTQYARYPEYAITKYGTMRRTNTTAMDIVRDFVTARGGINWRGLGSGMLPSCWQSVLSIGHSDVLNVNIGEVVFDGITLRSALEEIVKKVSNVGWRETFSLSGVRLDFFALAGDNISGSTAKTIICARAGEAVAGTHVAQISTDISTYEAYTRIVGHGGETARILSIPFWAGADQRAHALAKNWNTALEADVLNDLMGAKEPINLSTQDLDDEPEEDPKDPPEPPETPDEPEVDPEDPENPVEEPDPPEEPEEEKDPEPEPEKVEDVEMEKKKLSPECDQVFRSYKLPVSLVQQCLYIAESIPINEMKLCAVKMNKKLFWSNMWVDGCPADFCAGYYSTTEVTPEIITDVKIDLDTYTVELPQMVTQKAAYVTPLGETVKLFEPATFFVTLCTYGTRLIYDTGLPGDPKFMPLGAEGLTLRIQNENFQKIYLGSLAYPTTYLWDDQTLSIVKAPAVYKDDSMRLMRLCQAILDEKSEEKTAYSITLPWLDPTYKVGDRIILRGVTDFDFGRHTVCSVTYTPTQDHSTTINTDNSGVTYAQTAFDSYGETGGPLSE